MLEMQEGAEAVIYLTVNDRLSGNTSPFLWDIMY